jgi:hypothetical protein
MVLYKYLTHLEPASSDEFDKSYHPGERVNWSGIYRCIVCGQEIMQSNQNPLPSETHHEHAADQGSPTWMLVVTNYTRHP